METAVVAQIRQIREWPASVASRLQAAWADRRSEEGAISIEWLILIVAIVGIVAIATPWVVASINRQGKLLP